MAMRVDSVVRSVAGLAVVLGCTAAVYATCCKYNLTWVDPLGDPVPCGGGSTSYCESSSPACTQPNPPAAPNLACKINTITDRPAECVDIELNPQGWFIRGSCETSPGPQWTLIGTLPDGSCCWAYDIKKRTPSPNPGVFKVNVCENTCIAGA